MAERKIDLNVSTLSDTELNEEQKKRQERLALRAKLVTVLERGVTVDRLHVDLPPDMYGEWVPDDKVEIYRMESMGFQIDTEYARQRALHDDGTGNVAKVADAIYMTCSRVNKEVIDEIRLEQYEAANRPRSGKQKEERDFDNSARNEGLPSQIKSRVDSTNADNIRAAMTAKD